MDKEGSLGSMVTGDYVLLYLVIMDINYKEMPVLLCVLEIIYIFLEMVLKVDTVLNGSVLKRLQLRLEVV